MNELILVVVGGLVTALLTAGFTAWATGIWTTKKNSLYLQHFKEQILEIKQKQAAHSSRLNKVEQKVAILNHSNIQRSN